MIINMSFTIVCFKQAEFSLTVSSKYSLVIDDITIDEPHDTWRGGEKTMV